MKSRRIFSAAGVMALAVTIVMLLATTASAASVCLIPGWVRPC